MYAFAGPYAGQLYCSALFYQKSPKQEATCFGEVREILIRKTASRLILGPRKSPGAVFTTAPGSMSILAVPFGHFI
jgi:hypothetical protein